MSRRTWNNNSAFFFCCAWRKPLKDLNRTGAVQSSTSNGYLFDTWVDCVWNVMTHPQKPDFVFRRNGRVHLNRQVHQFSRLLAAEVCASAVVMLFTTYYEVVWRVLATHSIRQFSLHFPSRASPCAITFQLDSDLEPFPRELLSSLSLNTQIPLKCNLHIFQFTSPGALTLFTEADERSVIQDCRFLRNFSWSFCSFAIWNCLIGYPISDV